MSDDHAGGRARFPSRALRSAHAILVGAAIAFALGFALYLLLVAKPRLADGAAVWPLDVGAASSLAAGSGLAVYLRRFLRRTGAGRENSGAR
jgi:hypothetical protein